MISLFLAAMLVNGTTCILPQGDGCWVLANVPKKNSLDKIEKDWKATATSCFWIGYMMHEKAPVPSKIAKQATEACFVEKFPK